MRHRYFLLETMGAIMLTKIDLCSMALLKLGEQPIQSFSDDTATAQLARTLFEPISDALIASHPWRFAIRQLDLMPDTEGDFMIPSNVLRVLKSSGQVVGNKIIAPSDKITITACVRVDTDAYPSYFVSLLATKLAMEFCIPLSGDQTVFRMLTALYESELQSAKFIDSTTSPSAQIDKFSLINTRF